MQTGLETARNKAERDLSHTHEDLSSYMAKFLSSYQLRGDRENYTPSERDKLLVEDAVRGLLEDDQFVGIACRLQGFRRSLESLNQDAS
jgi:hypothetical protein